MAQEKSLYYKNLYGDFSDHTNPGDCYLEIKNRNKNTLEFVTLSPCLNLWYMFLACFGRFRVIPVREQLQK